MLIQRYPLGHVVEIDGPTLLLNLLPDTRGHVSGHRSGLSTVEQPGDLIGLEAGAEIIVARVLAVAFAEPKEVHSTKNLQTRIASQSPLRQLRAYVLGSIGRDSQSALFFSQQDWKLPVLGARAFPLASEEHACVLSANAGAGERISLGTEIRNPAVRVDVGVNDLLTRHFAILGATGQGKTHFVAAVIQKLLSAPKSRVIIFDVNGEYTNTFDGLGCEVQKTSIGGGNGGLKIPYFALGRHGLTRLLLPSEKTQMPALRFAIENLRYIEADAVGAKPAGQPDNVFFDDCRTSGVADAVRGLEAIASRTCGDASVWPHMKALSCLAAESYAIQPQGSGHTRNAFNYGHLSALLNRIRTFIEDARFQDVVDVSGGAPVVAPLDMAAESSHFVERVFGKPEFLSGQWNVHIVDVSQITHDLMPFVLGALLEMFAAELFKRGPGRTHPTLLVLEEAHHYLRSVSADMDAGQQALAYERLAKEGRKFGVSMCVSTQRPSEISSTVLAQCGTWAVFRLSNETDQRSVSAAAERADARISRHLTGLARGEAYVFGTAVKMPVRISVDRPRPEPDSSDPPFNDWFGVDNVGA